MLIIVTKNADSSRSKGQNGLFIYSLTVFFSCFAVHSVSNAANASTTRGSDLKTREASEETRAAS